ncbi:MAG: hypothetical protein ACRDCE_01485 [Cetobacterium sp.]|uniref:hypothetical protein n=1 Tax=Cetobacterium sp. TaxID=2071632 RepID=UPI003EE6739B
MNIMELVAKQIKEKQETKDTAADIVKPKVKKPHPMKGAMLLDPATMTEIPGFGGIYIMSKGGTIYMKEHTVTDKRGNVKTIPASRVEQKKGKWGDATVRLKRDGKSSTFSIKTLKRMTFDGVSLDEIKVEKEENKIFTAMCRSEAAYTNGLKKATEYGYHVDNLKHAEDRFVDRHNCKDMVDYQQGCDMFRWAIKISEHFQDTGEVLPMPQRVVDYFNKEGENNE